MSEQQIGVINGKPVPIRVVDAVPEGHWSTLSGMAARVQAFDAQHRESGQPVVDETRAIVLYPNGAQRSTNPEGVLSDPPRDDRERWQRITQYRQIITDRATAKFRELKAARENALKSAITGRPRLHNPVLSDPDAAIAELTKLRDLAAAARGSWLEARRNARAGVPDEQRALQARDAELRELAEKQLGRIGDIVL